MAKKSAGIILIRKVTSQYEILLVHPGGPFWAKKDKGVWSIPKGEFMDDEDGFSAAKREFGEELGLEAPETGYIELAPVKQSNKMVYAWYGESDLDISHIDSNLIEITWPPRTQQKISVPEVDRAVWCTFAEARVKLIAAQVAFIDQLESELGQLSSQAEQPTADISQISLF